MRNCRIATPLAVVAILLLSPVIAHAATYYVANAPSGNNGNPGTQASPWETLAHALNQVLSGDTIIMRGGTYAGDVEVDTDNITIESFTGETAHIATSHTSSSNSQCIWITAAGSTLRGLEISGGYYYCVKYEGTNNHLVEQCRIHGSGRDCVKITPQTDGTTFRQCEIYNSGQRDPSNAEGIDNVNGDDMHVVDCYIHDIATNGIYPKGGARNAIIERCLIMNTGSAGVFLGFVTDSVFMNLPGDNNPQYYENIDGTVRNCIFAHCSYAGIGLCSALNAKVYHNTCYDVGYGGGGAGLLFFPRDGDNSMNPLTENAHIANNIFVQTQGSRPMVRIRNVPHDTVDIPSLNLENNRYYRTSGSANYSNEQSGYNGNLSGWKANVGTDTASTEGDPGVNTTTFHLDSGSFCIGAGTGLLVADDYDDTARTSPTDIGADHYNPATALPTPPPSGTVGTGGGGGTVPGNQPPVASATITGPGIIGNVHTLDGTASNDPDSGPAPLTYQWTQTGGPTVTITGATSATATFNPTAVGTYDFELIVSDSAATDTDTVSIAITDPALTISTGQWDLSVNDSTVLPFTGTRTLTYGGTGTLTVTVSTNQSWVTATFDNGSGGNTLAASASGTITLTITSLVGLSQGTHNATLTITGNDGLVHTAQIAIVLTYLNASVGGNGGGGCTAGLDDDTSVGPAWLILASLIALIRLRRRNS